MIKSDIVITPDWVAKDMIQWFKPAGSILDPCRGDGAFTRHLPSGTDWCEIRDGRNFFDYTNRVDWLVGNPPYSCRREWMKHSFDIADNVLYLTPLHQTTNALGMLRLIRRYGWIKHIRIYDTGHSIPWARSRPIVAVHYRRGAKNETCWSFVDSAQDNMEENQNSVQQMQAKI